MKIERSGRNREEKQASIQCGTHRLGLDLTLIMGVLNVTPDSFSDGDLFLDPGRAVTHAKQMIEDGADIIDIGGESSRPGAEPVSEEEEMRRILPVVERLLEEVEVPLSIDTYKPRVAEKCLKRGAHIINDITGLRNGNMVRVIAKYGVPVIIMHMRGTPRDMQINPAYEDVVKEIKDFLHAGIAEGRRAGISDIIIDPGIGFGKSVAHNLQILRRLNEFTALDCPLMVGPSRKSFIGALAGTPVNERIEGTLAAVAIAILKGADIVRVHDVKECVKAARIADAIRRS